MGANIVSRKQWLEARLELLQAEKAHSRARDELTRARQVMPWVKIDKEYLFDGPDGLESLSDLFEDKSQLIVYHFMFDTDWAAGCKSCSFLADHYGPSIPHIGQRDVAMVTISKGPLEKLQEFQNRMGWSFKWLSSGSTDFNRDFNVSFTDEELAGKVYYNFSDGASFPAKEAPGISVFTKDTEGRIYHTYSSYSRGLENFIGAYALLDIVPKGRDEGDLPYPMEWLRLHDVYEQ